ncbi:hypothetical protein ATY35_09720 [Vibrio cidicii]|uniref:Uncharacterized protein n=1 Tax=Vibrio cidicii TaxID=1763883 RepID=A0ABR5W6H3_9VIBR|nr:hypothetical protein [Vibrio cidicii]KYN90559.1 hypothetical protein ATY35_09720 [Vibrio cidicii]
MKYTTQYLKSDSYESFYAECEKAGLVQDGEIVTSSHNYALVLLGELQKPTGKMLTDKEGNEYAETVPVFGYHANIRFKTDVGLSHLAVDVDTPLVVFAE